jgi:hypothetical protein
MRTVLIAGLTVAGICLAATSGASAAPVNSTVIGDVATENSHVTTVRYGSYGGHYSYGYGSRGGRHWRYGSRRY